MERMLITGGAGFISSYTADRLTEHGYHVTILDNLEPQVHGKAGRPPDYLNENAILINGDIRDCQSLTKTIPEVDAIIHLAAAVGVGQSMYPIEKYIDYNTRGTATLFKDYPTRRQQNNGAPARLSEEDK